MYEDQGGVQVFIISLDEFSVILLRSTTIHVVELGPVVLLG